MLSSDWYYPASALICGIIALSIGSAWTTAGTVGVGLVGIATMLDVSAAATAGAVISGSYFGDKLSPLSDSTIMTAQMLELDLYDHIRHEAWTAVPAFTVGFTFFFLLGLRTSPVLMSRPQSISGISTRSSTSRSGTCWRSWRSSFCRFGRYRRR